MQFGVTATRIDDIGFFKHAENLGFDFAWITDSPLLRSNPWAVMALAAQQPGFLGVESAREQVGITVSYWQDEASIRQWQTHAEHQLAQKLGKERWYATFALQVARVERSYCFP